MPFDREAAKRAGYSDEEINAYLKANRRPISQTQPVYDPFGAEGNPVAEGLLQGMTFGFSDEMQAGLKTAFDKVAGRDDRPWGEVYRQNVSDVRAPYKAFEQERPMTAMGLNIGGGLITGGALAAGGRTVPGLTRFAQTHPLLATSAAGATSGLVSGAGYAPTTEEIPEYSTSGAMLGAVLPGALKAGGRVGEVVTRPVRSAVKSVTGALDTPAQRGAKMVIDALRRDEISLNEAMKRLDDLGPEAKLVDIGGVNVQRLAQTIAATPGKAAQMAEDVLQGRMIRSPERLAARMRGIFKQNKSAYRYMKDTIEKRKQQAGPLYKEAFDVDATVPRDAMDELLAGLTNKINDFEGTSIGRTLKGVKSSLMTKGNPKIIIRKLHAAKLDLDKKISDSYDKLNKPTTLTSELMEQKRSLLKVLDSSDNYRQARQIFSDDSSVLNAINIGKRILKTEGEEMADILEGMSEAEKKGFISGAMQTISDKLMGTQEGANAARKLATPLIKSRLKNAFPDEAQYNRFIQGLEAEDIFAEVRNNVLRGSQTQQRLATSDISADEAANVVTGRWLSASLDAIRRFFTGQRQIPEPIRDELAELLFKDVMSGETKVSRELAKRVRRYDLSDKYLNGVITSIRQGMPVAAGQVGAIQEQ